MTLWQCIVLVDFAVFSHGSIFLIRSTYHAEKSIRIQLFRYNFVLNSSSDSVAKINTLGGT